MLNHGIGKELKKGMIKKIEHNREIVALIVSHRFNEPGVHFFTPDHFSQQLAYLSHPAGKVITPHVHNKVSREVLRTQEVLLVKRGKLRVDLYSKEREYLESHILEGGDVIMLASGGHGFEVLEEVEMFEVKQGPYSADVDKSRFAGITPDQTNIKE